MSSTKSVIILALIVILIDHKVNTNETVNQINHRQSRFLILPGSVYVNSTNWSPLDGIMKTWDNLINWKLSTFGAIKNWVHNLMSKTPIDDNCRKEGKPANQSMLHDLKSKLFKDWKKQSTTAVPQDNSDDLMPQTLQKTSTTSAKPTTSSPTESTNLLTSSPSTSSPPSTTVSSTVSSAINNETLNEI